MEAPKRLCRRDVTFSRLNLPARTKPCDFGGQSSCTADQFTHMYQFNTLTVMPLYSTVLHVVYRKGRSADNTEDLLTGAKIYAGPPGSSSRFLFKRIVNRYGLTENDFAYVISGDQVPDVVVVLAPMSPAA